MTTVQELEQAATKVLTTMGVVTKHNVVAQVEGLLAIVAELCGNFPAEIKAIDPRAWIQAASYGEHALQPHLEGKLVNWLHEHEKHPDWEYTSAECQRKTSAYNDPEGHGWVHNEEKDGGCTRYDHTEYHWFRRLKSDALKDDVDLSGLKVTPPEKMKLDEYLGKLRGVFCKGYMPSSTATTEFNSKPEYVRFVGAITHLNNGNDVYSLESSFEVSDLDEMNKLSQELGGEFFYKDNKACLIYGLEINGLRILTNLGTDATFVTIKRGDGIWQKWTKWSQWLSLPIDRYTLDKILENV